MTAGLRKVVDVISTLQRHLQSVHNLVMYNCRLEWWQAAKRTWLSSFSPRGVTASRTFNKKEADLVLRSGGNERVVAVRTYLRSANCHHHVFHSRDSPDSSPLSHSVLPVLFLPYLSFISLYPLYLFMTVALSPDIILCGWLGLQLKHQLTN